jgi:hypothetical protein
MDVPASKGGVVLRSLNITGYLRFLDDASVGPVNLSSQFIFVLGVLEIGQPDAHFRCACLAFAEPFKHGIEFMWCAGIPLLIISYSSTREAYATT